MDIDGCVWKDSCQTRNFLFFEALVVGLNDSFLLVIVGPYAKAYYLVNKSCNSIETYLGFLDHSMASTG